MNIFLKWLWLTCAVYSGLAYAYFLGFFHHIYKYDISHLTLLIYFIFVCLTFRMGIFAWKVDKMEVFNVRKETEKFEDMIGAWNARLQYIGIIGTSLGLAIAFQSFGGGEKSDLLAKVGTSIYNVVVSLGAYTLLDVMCRHVVQSVKSKYEIY
jgi:hypothetical protein